MEASAYLVRLCRYVLLNPVRAGLCSHPKHWRWNSFKSLAFDTPSSCVDIESLLRQIADADPEVVRAQLVSYVEPDADPEMATLIRSDRRVIGTPAFEEQFRRAARAASREVPEREQRTGTPSLTEILAAAVRDGEGLAGGVRRARESAGYRSRRSRDVPGCRRKPSPVSSMGFRSAGGDLARGSGALET